MLQALIPETRARRLCFLALAQQWSDLALQLRAYHRPELRQLCQYAQASALFTMRKKLRAAGLHTVQGLPAGSSREEMLELGLPLSLRPLKARVEATERWEWPTQLPDFVPADHGVDKIPFAQKVWAHDFLFHGQSSALFWTEVCIPAYEYITPMPLSEQVRKSLEHVHFQLIQLLPQLEHYCGFLHYSLYVETRALDTEQEDFEIQLDRISLELPNALWMQIFAEILGCDSGSGEADLWQVYLKALLGEAPQFKLEKTEALGLRFLSPADTPLNDWGPLLFAQAVPGVEVLHLQQSGEDPAPWPPTRDYVVLRDTGRAPILEGLDSVVQLLSSS